MKLKYYLRGLGIGIVVTAIIMSFTRQPEKLTDAQIKLRALELGMVEKSVLADLQKQDEKDSQDENIALEDVLMSEGEALIGEELPIESELEEQKQEEALGENSNETVQSEANSSEESSTDMEMENTSMEPDSTIAVENTDNSSGSTPQIAEGMDNNTADIPNAEAIENYIIITVEGGNGSEVVSRRLYEAGLVNSAVEYNQFLIDNGYSRILKVGNHEIPVGATEEQMAKILCGIE